MKKIPKNQRMRFSDSMDSLLTTSEQLEVFEQLKGYRVRPQTIDKWATKAIRDFGVSYDGIQAFKASIVQHIKCNTRKK